MFIYSQDNSKIGAKNCHQMSDFKAKMHQIRFPLGLTALRQTT